ncbi:type 4a pilus biogenesis protein PilO [Hahella ganghwensis]|uniref:type 4a pilus biogenesis protein PilO n=1 Tax=Hahella ganghwensis TaxID=286420 RepID=UPI0003698B86|nr:type II secretion system protein M [Hahella ganghwensis]
MKWKQLAKKVNSLNPREKVILLITCIAVLMMVFLQFVWGPQWQSQKQNNQSLLNGYLLNESLKSQRQTLQRALEQDPNVALRKENQQLQAQLQEKEDELRASLSRLVTPEEMPQLLVTLLGNNPGLKVVKVEKLPSQKIQQGEGESAAVLYSHKVNIIVEGSFFDALNYVRKVESDTGRVRLISLDYRVEQYPRGVLVLGFETLGLDERWLGV